MKPFLIAAAALALPAMASAQMTPSQATPADPATTTAPGNPSVPGGTDAAQSMPSGGMNQPQSAGTADPSMGSAPGGTMSGGATPGGYQPSGSAMQGTMTPGVQPTYRQAASPSEAYPAPAAKDHYPVCKKGQYDGCVEAGGSGGTSHKMMHHRRK